MAKILLVDDERAITDNLSPFLERAGYVVAVAADGEDALSKAASFAPDLIVSDILMPRLDGRVLGFTLSITLGAGLLFGLANASRQLPEVPHHIFMLPTIEQNTPLALDNGGGHFDSHNSPARWTLGYGQLQPALPSLAILLQGTRQATGIPMRAHEGSQFHQCLVELR